MENPLIVGVRPAVMSYRSGVSGYHPIGILSVLAFVRRAGFDVSFLDLLSSGPGCERVLIDAPVPVRHLRKKFYRYGAPPAKGLALIRGLPRRPDAFFVTSGITYWYYGLLEARDWLRKCWPGVPLVLGGTYASLEVDHAKAQGFDYVVSGEGEVAALNIAQELTGYVSGVSLNPADLDSYPRPAWDLAGKMYQPGHTGTWCPVLSSRGCPRRCTYCASYRCYSFGFRQKSPARFVDELLFYRDKYKHKKFLFLDENILYNRDEHIKVIFDRLLSLVPKYDLTFITPNSTDAALYDLELCKLMMRAGVRRATTSIEVVEGAALRKMGRTTSAAHVRQAVKWLHQVGYTRDRIHVYVLVGLPGQRKEAVIDTLLYVWSIGATPAALPYTPIRGTVEHDQLTRDGSIPAEYDPVTLSAGLVPCQSEHLTYSDVVELRSLTKRIREGIYMGVDVFSNSPIMQRVRSRLGELLTDGKGHSAPLSHLEKTRSPLFTPLSLSQSPAEMLRQGRHRLGYLPDRRYVFSIAEVLTMAQGLTTSTLIRFDDILQPVLKDGKRYYCGDGLEKLLLLMQGRSEGKKGKALRELVLSIVGDAVQESED